MGKGIILGIDFSIDFTQMAVLDDEINPRSISIGTEDNFLIPSVVCYNSELNEWSAGDEAVNKSRLNNSTEYRKAELWGRFNKTDYYNVYVISAKGCSKLQQWQINQKCSCNFK